MENWHDLVVLFECRGGPKYCWCMAWRKASAQARKLKSTARQAALKECLHGYVRKGIPVGIVMYNGEEAIAWCSVAPRDSYRPLGGLEVIGEDLALVWSIACFFVKRKYRGTGLTRRLLSAAVEYASNCGAAVIEAYPVDLESPSFRFMGLVGTFESAGFVRVGRAGKRRHVMRRRCS